MNELQKFILAYLGASLGLTNTEIEDKVLELETNEETRKEFFNLHKTRIADLKKNAMNDGYKKAEAKVKSTFESELKEKYGVESDKQGVELIEEIVKANAKTEASGKELSDDEIKKHPLYLGLEKELNKANKKFDSELQAKIAEVEKGFAMKETKRTVVEKALAQFDALNPILSTDSEKAARQKALVRREIEAGNYQIDGDTILILNEDGSRKEDGHGNAVKFEDFVKETSDNLGFDYKKAEERSSSAGGSNSTGATGAAGSTEKKYTGKLPVNQAEYDTIAFDSTIPIEARLEVQQYWSEQAK